MEKSNQVESAQAVKPIALKTKLGNCKLDISAQFITSEIEKLAEYALQYLIWHIVPAKAYEKDAPYSRNSEHSPELEKYLDGHIRSIIGKHFSDIKIGMSKYVAPDSAEGIIAKLDKLDAAGIAKIEAKLKAAKEKVASKTAEKTEAKSANMAQAA